MSPLSSVIAPSSDSGENDEYCLAPAAVANDDDGDSHDENNSSDEKRRWELSYWGKVREDVERYAWKRRVIDLLEKREGGGANLGVERAGLLSESGVGMGIRVDMDGEGDTADKWRDGSLRRTTSPIQSSLPAPSPSTSPQPDDDDNDSPSLPPSSPPPLSSSSHPNTQRIGSSPSLGATIRGSSCEAGFEDDLDDERMDEQREDEDEEDNDQQEDEELEEGLGLGMELNQEEMTIKEEDQGGEIMTITNDLNKKGKEKAKEPFPHLISTTSNKNTTINPPPPPPTLLSRNPSASKKSALFFPRNPSSKVILAPDSQPPEIRLKEESQRRNSQMDIENVDDGAEKMKMRTDGDGNDGVGGAEIGTIQEEEEKGEDEIEEDDNNPLGEGENNIDDIKEEMTQLVSNISPPPFRQTISTNSTSNRNPLRRGPGSNIILAPDSQIEEGLREGERPSLSRKDNNGNRTKASVRKSSIIGHSGEEEEDPISLIPSRQVKGKEKMRQPPIKVGNLPPLLRSSPNQNPRPPLPLTQHRSLPSPRRKPQFGETQSQLRTQSQSQLERSSQSQPEIRTQSSVAPSPSRPSKGKGKEKFVPLFENVNDGNDERERERREDDEFHEQERSEAEMWVEEARQVPNDGDIREENEPTVKREDDDNLGLTHNGPEVNNKLSEQVDDEERNVHNDDSFNRTQTRHLPQQSPQQTKSPSQPHRSISPASMLFPSQDIRGSQQLGFTEPLTIQRPRQPYLLGLPSESYGQNEETFKSFLDNQHSRDHSTFHEAQRVPRSLEDPTQSKDLDDAYGDLGDGEKGELAPGTGISRFTSSQSQSRRRSQTKPVSLPQSIQPSQNAQFPQLRSLSPSPMEFLRQEDAADGDVGVFGERSLAQEEAKEKQTSQIRTPSPTSPISLAGGIIDIDLTPVKSQRYRSPSKSQPPPHTPSQSETQMLLQSSLITPTPVRLQRQMFFASSPRDVAKMRSRLRSKSADDDEDGDGESRFDGKDGERGDERKYGEENRGNGTVEETQFEAFELDDDDDNDVNVKAKENENGGKTGKMCIGPSKPHSHRNPRENSLPRSSLSSSNSPPPSRGHAQEVDTLPTSLAPTLAPTPSNDDMGPSRRNKEKGKALPTIDTGSQESFRVTPPPPSSSPLPDVTELSRMGKRKSADGGPSSSRGKGKQREKGKATGKRKPNETETVEVDGSCSENENPFPPAPPPPPPILANLNPPDITTIGGRSLRARKAVNLNPYSVEMAKYEGRLRKNDWQDAVVRMKMAAREKEKAERKRHRTGEEDEEGGDDDADADDLNSTPHKRHSPAPVPASDSESLMPTHTESSEYSEESDYDDNFDMEFEVPYGPSRRELEADERGYDAPVGVGNVRAGRVRGDGSGDESEVRRNRRTMKGKGKHKAGQVSGRKRKREAKDSGEQTRRKRGKTAKKIDNRGDDRNVNGAVIDRNRGESRGQGDKRKGRASGQTGVYMLPGWRVDPDNQAGLSSKRGEFTSRLTKGSTRLPIDSGTDDRAAGGDGTSSKPKSRGRRSDPIPRSKDVRESSRERINRTSSTTSIGTNSKRPRSRLHALDGEGESSQRRFPKKRKIDEFIDDEDVSYSGADVLSETRKQRGRSTTVVPDSDEDAGSISASPEPEADVLKLGGTRAKALGYMMPKSFFKKAQKDLEKMVQEKGEGRLDRTEFHDWDKDNEDGFSGEEIARVRRGIAVRRLGNGGPLDLRRQGIYTDGSEEILDDGSDGESLGDVDSDGDTGAVVRWKRAFAPDTVDGSRDTVEEFMGSRKHGKSNRRKSKNKSKDKGKEKTRDLRRTHSHQELHPLRQSRLPFAADTHPISCRDNGDRPPNNAARYSGSRRPKTPPIILDEDALFAHHAPAPLSGVRGLAGLDSNNIDEPLPGILALGPQPSLHSNPAEDIGLLKYNSFSADFGIKKLPSGVKLHKGGITGSGHLHELLSFITSSVPDNDSNWNRACFAFGLNLDLRTTTQDGVEAALPTICDGIFDEAKARSASPVQDVCLDTVDSLCFLASYLSIRIRREERQSFMDLIQSQLAHLRRRFDVFRSASKQAVAQATVMLDWIDLEFALRIAKGSTDPNKMDAVKKTFRRLVSTLVLCGINITMQSLKSSESQGFFPDDGFKDLPLDIWVSVLSLVLHETALTFFGLKSEDFWSFIEAENEGLHRTGAQIICMESLAYTTMALCCISQFNASGISNPRARLLSHWKPFVAGITALRPETFEQSEKSLSNSALTKRDRFIKTCFARILRLMEAWDWSLTGQEHIIITLAPVFKSRRLGDLPTEGRTEFPRFLLNFVRSGQRTAEGIGASQHEDDPTFHLFLEILFRLFYSQPGCENDREAAKAERLLSRLLPITLNFSRYSAASVEAAQEKTDFSSLVNYCSFIVLSNVLLPSKLDLQLKKLLQLMPLSTAAHQARAIVTRTLLYTGMVQKGQGRELSPWFVKIGECFPVLKEGYFSITNNGPSANNTDTVPAKSSDQPGVIKPSSSFGPLSTAGAEHFAMLMAVFIIGIEQVLSLNEAESQPEYPDLRFLHESWTSGLLNSPLGAELKVGGGIIKLLDSFLRLRAQILPKKRSQSQSTDSGDSQELFSHFDIDLDDPQLEALLDPEAAERKRKADDLDKSFAQMLKDRLVPSLRQAIFNLYHPLDDRQSSLSTKERGTYGRQIVDCWTSCMDIAARHNKPLWTDYIRYGAVSWHKIRNRLGRLQVAIRLHLNMLKEDPTLYKTFRDESLSVWFQTIVSHNITFEHEYTCLLFKLDTSSPLFRNLPLPQRPGTNLDDQLPNRDEMKARQSEIVCSLLRNIPTILTSDNSTDNDPNLPPLKNNLLSKWGREMLEAIRDNLVAPSSSELGKQEYQQLSRTIVQEFKNTCVNGLGLVSNHDYVDLVKQLGIS